MLFQYSASIKTALSQRLGFGGMVVPRILNLTPLITTIVVFNSFMLQIKSLLFRMKSVLKHQHLQIFVVKLNKNE